MTELETGAISRETSSTGRDKAARDRGTSVNEVSRSRRKVILNSAPSPVASQVQNVSGNVAGFVSATELSRRRRQARDPGLLEAVKRLDAEPSREAQLKILNWLQQEYDARGGGPLIGLFSRCYLGAPYVDHMLNLLGQICEHYSMNESPQGPYVGARALARNLAYAYVEVYADGAVIPVRIDGTQAI